MDDLSEREIVAVNRRAEAFKRTGDPNFLWPGVSETARLAALGAIERCVATVLAGDDPVSLAGDAEALGVAALTSGTGPLLGFWAETGRVTVNADVRTVLAYHLAHGRARTERLDRGLGEALDTLAAAGVSVTLLKGTHTARAYYAEPGLRPMGDIDLLVAPAARRRAERALARAGWTRGERQRAPYKCDWKPPGVDTRVRSFSVLHAWEPWSVELHTSLDRIFAPGRVAHLPLRPGDDEPWEMFGRSVRVLTPPLSIVHLAAHASEESHVARLLRVLELVLACRAERAGGRLVWSELRAVAAERRVAGFLYPALAFAERLAPGAIEPQVLSECAGAAGPRVRAIVDGDTAADRLPLDRVRVAEKFMWSRGPVDTVRRLGLMLWPKTSGSFGDMVRTYARRAYRLYHGRFIARRLPEPPE
ncbi:MAG TPA: nucleotidyltransferase family protein [Gemmatimonadaceae bacterium]|nr:nucleotidyltransferase family protein [Gemmatimonadaceae bacterium]